MDIRSIRYFLSIAEEENVSKAAERLRISQPPLSRHLKQMEEELGVELFYREKGRLLLTDAGYFLKERAKEILELTDKTEKQLREMYCQKEGNIYIGTIETVGANILPEWISCFHKAFPDITYHINSGNTDDIMKKVDSGIYDIGIVREPFNGEKFDSIRFPEDSWIACMRRDHPLAASGKDTINLSELAQEDLILPGRNIHEEQIKKWFEILSVKPRVVCWYTALINGMMLARNGIGILLCPKSAEQFVMGEDIVCREIINPKLTSSAVVIWKKDKRMTPAAKRFLGYVREAINFMV